MVENIFYVLLSLIPALLNAGILVYIFLFLPRSRTTDIFALFVFALILWQGQDTIDRICTTLETAQYWESILSIGWISVAPFAFHFACRYASISQFYKNRMALIALYLPFVVLQLLHTRKGAIVFVHHPYWGWITTPEPLSLDAFLRYYVSVVVLAAVFILIRHAYKMRNDKEKRGQAFLVAAGILLPAIQGVTTQVVLPLVFLKQDLPLTSTFLTFFSIGTLISLARYKLFNLSESVEVERIMENFKNIVIIVSPDKKVLYMNPYASGLFQRPGHLFFDIDTIFPSANFYNQFRNEVFDTSLKGAAIKNYPTVLQTPEGVKMDVLISAEMITNNKHIQGLLIVGNDITEHLKTLKALKESNERYDLIGKATNDMVWDWNVVTGEIYRNREGWRKLFEADLPNEIGTTEEWLSRIHPEDYNRIHLIREGVFNLPDDHFEIEFRVVKKDGSIAYLLDRGYALRDENGKLVRLIGATQDITQRKLAEIKLKGEQLMRHREVTDAVISAQENERRHIGAELHDNVNQILTSAMLYLNLAETEQANKTSLLKQAKEILGNAVSEIRKLSHSLIPPSLNAESLTDALTRILDTAKRSGLTVESEITTFDETILSEKMKLAIYRIIQEQFSNINKYANARKVSVKLLVKNEQLLLSIKDDGIGFDPSKNSSGVGLTNIKTRTSLHNGKMKISSSPGQGCILEVIFPVSQIGKAA
jgi:signal transduction histidine kinase